MKIRGISLVLGTLFLGTNSVFAKAIPLRRSVGGLKCNPIGRLLDNAGKDYPDGSLLCNGDNINLSSGRNVLVLCYLNKNILTLRNGDVLSRKCMPHREAMLMRCSPEYRKSCRSRKGPGEENKPELIRPYDSVLLDNRPTLSWYAMPSADSYTVEVNGVGLHWEEKVKGTTLTYPPDQPRMGYGNAYKITVIAYKDDSPLNDSSYSQRVFNLLPDSKAKEITAIVKHIESLKIPKDEAAYSDLDTIYMASGLLNEAINALRSRVEEGSDNPGVYRLLADRLLEAGLPVEAKSQYERASKLAENSSDSSELARSLAGLEFVQHHMNEIPTRLDSE